jgi:hypothetical protein
MGGRLSRGLALRRGGHRRARRPSRARRRTTTRPCRRTCHRRARRPRPAGAPGASVPATVCGPAPLAGLPNSGKPGTRKGVPPSRPVTSVTKARIISTPTAAPETTTKRRRRPDRSTNTGRGTSRGLLGVAVRSRELGGACAHVTKVGVLNGCPFTRSPTGHQLPASCAALQCKGPSSSGDLKEMTLARARAFATIHACLGSRGRWRNRQELWTACPT